MATSNGWLKLPPMAAARSQLGSSLVPQSDPLFSSQPLQAQLQPQLQATGSSLNNIRPIDNLNNTLSHFLESLNRQTVQQRHFSESFAKSDRRLEELISSVSSIRETADGLTKKLDAHDRILETLERSSRAEDKKVKDIDVMKVLVGEMKAFKKTLGKSCDGDDGRTVLGRLDAITFAVGELLERARDPEANRQ
jgi:chromosome segregation ATPase